MLGQLAALGVEEGPAVLVLSDPFSGEDAVLDVRQHRLHVLLGLLIGENPGTGDILAVFRRVGDGVVHHGHSALVDQVDDQLHFVDAFEVGVLRSVARLHQSLEAQLHQLHYAAAEDGLLAEEIGLRLILEGGLHDAASRAADARRISQGQIQGLPRGVLLHGDEAGHALARHIGGPDGVARALGGDHGNVHPGGGHDLLEMDVEAVGKHQHVPRLQVGGDVGFIDVRLDLVVHQNHDDVGPFGGVRHGLDLQSRPLGVFPVFGALAEAHTHVAAGLLQVQGVGVALGAVADDADFLPVQLAQIAVLLIVHSCHIHIPPSICSRHISCYALSRWR